MNEKGKVLTGDVRVILGEQPASSFCACLADPPYGISFMGKEWDGVVPGPELWVEVLRVLEPGAPLLAFGGTRTFHRLACAIEDAGFLLSDTLCWLHGQGFPKGHAQLKPAWEPITLAWKKGPRALAIDAARVGSVVLDSERRTCAPGGGKGGLFLRDGRGNAVDRHNPLGRWPANVILDEEAGEALDVSHGNGKGEGGASRFFYCAKASRSERGEGNTHPTVKPIKLCEYLARLILPPERDTPRRLLVPFSGSGSEMVGAIKAGWDEVIGIEVSEEYSGIASARLAAARDEPRLPLLECLEGRP